MIDIGIVLLLVSVLLVVAAGVQPLAHVLRLPPSVLLAAVGILIGSLAWPILGGRSGGTEAVETLLTVPLHSTTFLYGFLPPLLFQAALTIDMRRMLDDAAPILLLAVVAVVVATGVVGLSLAQFSGGGLIACLLVGAIIATTDPAAVIVIFRDIGAPARLTRLVEGESLLNDAAAIALFTMIVGILTGSESGGVWELARNFVTSFAGGLLLGLAIGRLLVSMIPLLRDIAAAEFTLTLSAPWLAFIIGERLLHVSGVVAVVATALIFAASGPGRFSPGNWSHLQRTWEQLSAIAGSLVFMLAAILVPRLASDVSLRELLLILGVVGAALLARAFVVFVLMPLLSASGFSERVGTSHKLVIVWGGLRGAVTLALALSITENNLFPPEVKRFVAVIATGFVLFTLFVNGVTLRPLMRALHLDRLSPVNEALRDEVLAIALNDVAQSARQAGRDYGIPENATGRVAESYEERAQPPEKRLSARDSLNVALLALAHRERALILAHHGHRTVSADVVEKMLRHAARLFEGARNQGRYGYARAARGIPRFSRGFRLAFILHRYLGIERLLALQLEERFALLLVSRLVLMELEAFAQASLRRLLGERVSTVAAEVLATRQTAVNRALDALRLQYPEYAEALEHRFVQRYALAEEARQYERLFDDGLIGEELYEHLRHSIRERRREERLPQLDLGLNTRVLMQNVPLLHVLDDAQLREVSSLLRPIFAMPGERIVREGESGDGMYFISSGAAEVRLARNPVRLGRGEFFGELALLTRQPRSADVVALTYSQLLWLPEADFSQFLSAHPELREQFERVAESRRPTAGVVASHG